VRLQLHDLATVSDRVLLLTNNLTTPGRASRSCVTSRASTFDAQPSIDKAQIREIASGRFIANGEAVLLLGPPGVGKTFALHR
jgi:DNA replication protein DnaC